MYYILILILIRANKLLTNIYTYITALSSTIHTNSTFLETNRSRKVCFNLMNVI